MAFFFIILGAGLVWLAALSALFYKIYSHYNRLTKGTKQKDLMKALEKLISLQKEHDASIKGIERELASLDRRGGFHLQRVGLVRFNPFNETGGEQSFSLAILDGHGTGVILTGLHARDRTRVYTKPIAKGESQYELSIEERKALKEALK